MSDKTVLPPLPPDDMHNINEPGLYTADQMRQYARSAVLAAATPGQVEAGSLLRMPSKTAPMVCYCKPGKCTAPRPNWCRDPAKASASVSEQKGDA